MTLFWKATLQRSAIYSVQETVGHRQLTQLNMHSSGQNCCMTVRVYVHFSISIIELLLAVAMAETAHGELSKRSMKRPMNAFLIFCKRQRGHVREKNPHVDNRSVTRILGDLWANLDVDEKSVYTNLAKQVTSFIYLYAVVDTHLIVNTRSLCYVLLFL